MRAATMKERPSSPLMRQTDVQSIYHMQMPRWLFSDPRYAGMGLDAKVRTPSLGSAHEFYVFNCHRYDPQLNQDSHVRIRESFYCKRGIARTDWL